MFVHKIVNTNSKNITLEFQPSVPTIDARQCLKVHNPQQDTSPQGTVSSLQKHKRYKYMLVQGINNLVNCACQLAIAMALHVIYQ